MVFCDLFAVIVSVRDSKASIPTFMSFINVYFDSSEVLKQYALIRDYYRFVIVDLFCNWRSCHYKA